MKVYVAVVGWDYEGEGILSIHSSLNSAKSVLEKCADTKPDCYHDKHEVREYYIEE